MTSFANKRDFCRKVARFDGAQANSKRVAKNTIVLYVRMLAVMAIGLYTGRVTFNALGVTDYGLQSIAGGVIGMITFMMGSLSSASSRFIVVEMGSGSLGTINFLCAFIARLHFRDSVRDNRVDVFGNKVKYRSFANICCQVDLPLCSVYYIS